MKITRTRILEITAVVILTAIFLRVFLSLELYSDDIYYASFAHNGFSGFWEKAKDHFLNFNGRNLVHLIIWCALAIGRGFTAVLMCAVLLAIPFLGARLCNGKALLTSVFFLLLVMSVSPFILRESIFWTSGFFNYVFPFLCLICALILADAALEGKKTWVLALVCAAQFLLAATMEQIGAATVFATALFAAKKMTRCKRFLPGAALFTLCGFLGWLSIFASPATRARFNGEIDTNAALFIRSNAGSFTQIGSHVIFGSFAVCLAFIAVSALVSARRSVWIFASATSAGIVTARIFGGTLLCLAAFLMLCAYTVLLGIHAIKNKAEHFRGILLLSGVFSAGIISVTDSAEPRSAVMLILCFALFTALSATELTSYVLAIKAAQNVAKALLSLTCAIIFIPTFMGYIENEAIRNENLSSIEEARQTGELLYSIDYDTKYAHSLMFDDGHFYNTFVALHDLEGVRVRLVSDILPSIYCEDAAVPCPVIDKDGKQYFPLEPIAEALGGGVAWSPQKTEIHVLGRKLILEGNNAYVGDTSFDVSQSLRRDFCCMLVTEDFLEEIAGVNCDFSDDDNSYKIYKNNSKKLLTNDA